MNKKIKAGFFQFSPKLGNPGYAIERIRHAGEKLRTADIVVIPELANSGYNFQSTSQAFEYSEDISKSQYVDFLAESSRKWNTYFVTGFNENAGDRIYNSALLIGDGKMLGKYRKIHLFMNEKDYFTPGDLGLPVFDIGICKIGMLICFDYLFPEIWRIVGLKGAELVCHPSNLITQYARKVVPSHGIVNRYFIITANRTGTEYDLSFRGESMITDPDGEILSLGSAGGEEAQFSEIDTGRSHEKHITGRNHVFKDRLPDQYDGLI